MIIILTAILPVLFIVMFFGGLIDLSFMENDSRRYRKDEKENQQSGGGEGGQGKARRSVAAGLDSRLAAQNHKNSSRL